MSAGIRNLRKAWSIRALFLLFGAIIVLPLVILAGFLLQQVAERDRDQLERRMVQIAAGVAAELDRELQRRITILQTLATSPRLSQTDFAGFHQQASAVLRGDGTGIFLLDRSLQQLLNTYVPFGTALPTYGAPETARRALELKTPQISDFFIGRVTKRPAFDINVPVIQDGEVLYILAMGLEPFVLQPILRDLNLPPEWVLSIADRSGIILARSQEEGKYVGTSLTSALSTQRSGITSRAFTLDGEAVLRATARSSFSRWQVAVNFPAAHADAIVRSNLILLGLWSMLALVLAVVGAIWFARLVARPIQAASRAATDLAQDRAVSPFESCVIEANGLIAALHQASLDLSKAHEKQQLLLNELNHRVKNLLSIVIAVATRTLSPPQLKEVREHLIQRFHALARAHDLLTESRWEGAFLAKLVEAELSPFAGRIRAQGPDVVLNPSAAQTMTMILHELATNAAKYGALSNPQGQVDLVWSLRPGENTHFFFHWVESGGPVVNAPVRKGFGTSLLERSLPEAIARLSYAVDGLQFELDVPASAVLAASSVQLGATSREVMRIVPASENDQPRVAVG